jgi:hypothetical protein
MKRAETHTIIAKTFIGKSGLCVNHRDLNKLNNSLINLELISQRENVTHYSKKTNLVGSTFIEKLNKYQSYAYINKKGIYLGLFDTAQQAHERYKQALIEYGLENKYA